MPSTQTQTVSLADAQSRDDSTAPPLRIVAGPVECNGSRLAVADSGGHLVLVRERPATEKRPAAYKRTAQLSHFADALDAGIIGS